MMGAKTCIAGLMGAEEGGAGWEQRGKSGNLGDRI
jgi:hypothetical protein